jgi:hypothetical protein
MRALRTQRDLSFSIMTGDPADLAKYLVSLYGERARDHCAALLAVLAERGDSESLKLWTEISRHVAGLTSDLEKSTTDETARRQTAKLL